MSLANLFLLFHTARLCGVGLKDGRVREEDIAVSGTARSFYNKRYARLDLQGNSNHHGGWLGCYAPCGKLTISYLSSINIPSILQAQGFWAEFLHSKLCCPICFDF